MASLKTVNVKLRTTRSGVRSSEAWGGAAVCTALLGIASNTADRWVGIACIAGAVVLVSVYTIARTCLKGSE